MFVDGILYAEKVGTAKFVVDLIPKSNTTSRSMHPMKPSYITVHTTANRRLGANARMHTEYVDTAKGYVSWHFTVDDEFVFQELPIIEEGYHAGDGDGPGNTKSIGIELCVDPSSNWEATKHNAIKLITLLLNQIGQNPSMVVPHKKWSGKYCPRKILDEGWQKFLYDCFLDYEYKIISNDIQKLIQENDGLKKIIEIKEAEIKKEMKITEKARAYGRKIYKLYMDAIKKRG